MNGYHEAFAAYIIKTDLLPDIKQEAGGSQDVEYGIEHGSKSDLSKIINSEDVKQVTTVENTDSLGCGKSECNEEATIKFYHVLHTVKEVECGEDYESRITNDVENNTVLNDRGLRLPEALCEDNLKVKEKIRQYKCKFCKYKAKAKYYLVRHFRRMHDENIELFPCDLCEYKSKYKQGLKRHKDVIHRGIFPWYHCQFCDMKTKREWRLQDHMKFRHSEDGKQVQCRLCGRTFKTESSLSNHFSYKHNENAVVYRCFHCEYTSKIKTHLKNHISGKHKKNIEVYMCLHCEYRSKFESKLKEHMSRTHGEKADLQHCHSYISENESDFNKSVIYTHDCEFCDFKAKDKPSLREHFKSRHKEVSQWLQCRFCDQTYRAKDTLKRHINWKHKESATCYQCPHCNFTTKIRNVLPRHIKNRHNENAVLYQCLHCQHKSKSEHHLKHHINNIHDNKNIEWCQCKFCYFTTKSEYGLWMHFERKHNGKISTADDSSSEHSQQSISTWNRTPSKLMNMKDHKNNKSECDNDINIKTTTDDQLNNENAGLYPCSYCEYKFKSEDNLKDHINNIHEKVGWYQCQFCCFITKFKYGLRRHLGRIHGRKISTIKKLIKSKCDSDVNVNVTIDNQLDNENALLYPCSRCEYKSISEDNLKHHISDKHEKVEWYRCQFCYFTTKFKYGLRQHLGKKHKRKIKCHQSHTNYVELEFKFTLKKGEKNIESDYDV